MRFLAKSDEKYAFWTNTVTKASKPGKQPPDLWFYAFNKNGNLCSVRTLEYYLKISEPWWTSADHSQLLFGIIKPHKSISSAKFT